MGWLDTKKCAAAGLPAVAQDLQMWERSGGNAGMVDEFVAMWNDANPDRKINLTYIPHTEMVPKIAQGSPAARSRT
jgi:multiple sugar transport system substrate-binding protein